MRVLVAGLLGVGLLTAGAAADELVVGGKRQPGKLVSVEGGVLTFAVTGTGQPTRVAVKDVTAVDFAKPPPPPGQYDELELVDGSLIRCTGFRVKGKVVEPELPDASGVKATIALDTLFAVLRAAHEPKNREEWKKVLAGRGKRDLFVFRGEEGFTPVPGTVLDGTEAGDAVRFERESDGQIVNFKLVRASGGLVFNPPPRAVLPPTLCKAIDRFGGTLTVQAVAVSDTGIKVTTVAGAVFEYPAGGLVRLDFAQSNQAYLSDLEPKVDAPPAVPGEPAFTFLRDRTGENAPLRLDGQPYPKGLWLVPDVSLTFPLNGEYREFRAVAGIDETVTVANSAVRLVVEVDGRPVFNEVVSRKAKPRPLAVDVKGAKALTVRAEPQGLYLGNQLVLADAKVQK